MYPLYVKKKRFLAKAIATDLLREQLKNKLQELKSEAENVTSNPHDLSLLEDALEEVERRVCVQRLRHLRSNVLAVQVAMSRLLAKQRQTCKCDVHQPRMSLSKCFTINVTVVLCKVLQLKKREAVLFVSCPRNWT